MKLLLIMSLSLILLESIARVIYLLGKYFPQIAGGVQYVEFLKNGRDKFTGPIEPRPYGLYWNRPNYFRKGFQQTDSNGFRFKGYDVNINKSKKRILAYGGSTTFSDHVFKDPTKCWTFLLENTFQENGYGIEVVNCGLNYALTNELSSHLFFEGTHFNPDFVLLHGPGNDSLPVAIGDTTHDYRKTRKSKAITPRTFEPRMLQISAISRLAYCLMFREYVFAHLEPESWDPVGIQNERMKYSDLSSFKNNVRNFVGICLSRNIKVILVDFLQNDSEKIEFYKPGLSEGMISIVDKMNEFFNIMARENEENILHVRFSSNAFNSSDFYDTCHLTEIGEAKKAKIIYAAIREFVQG